jgi:hypothetical protein
MKTREIAVETLIAAPPARVWPVMSDVERWPEWTQSVTKVERLETGPMGPGARARVFQPKLRPAVWTVTDWRPGSSFTWESRTPGLRAVGLHEALPEGGGTRARLAVRFEGPLAGLVAWLAGGLTLRYIQLEAAGLKARAEGK